MDSIDQGKSPDRIINEWNKKNNNNSEIMDSDMELFRIDTADFSQYVNFTAETKESIKYKKIEIEN